MIKLNRDLFDKIYSMKWLINHLTLTIVMILMISAVYCATPSESQKPEPLLKETPSDTVLIGAKPETQNITMNNNIQKPSLLLFVSSG
jgi:hypothetical protein